MSGSYEDLLAELFEPIGDVSFRKMFGGLGVFREGMMFALVAGDVLCFKTDDATRGDFDAEECGPFVYGAKDGPRSTSYWRAPERLLDEPDEFRDWAMKAVKVAERSKERAVGKKPKPGGS